MSSHYWRDKYTTGTGDFNRDFKLEKIWQAGWRICRRKRTWIFYIYGEVQEIYKFYQCACYCCTLLSWNRTGCVLSLWACIGPCTYTCTILSWNRKINMGLSSLLWLWPVFVGMFCGINNWIEHCNAVILCIHVHIMNVHLFYGY